MLRPLSHICPNWELIWDYGAEEYFPEPDTFAADLNQLICEISACKRPSKYHNHEDFLAMDTLNSLGWPIQKVSGRWIGADYQCILEQGSFSDVGQMHLISSACGRVHTVLDFGQVHFEEMDAGHMTMLASVMTIAIYQKTCDGTARYSVPI